MYGYDRRLAQANPECHHQPTACVALVNASTRGQVRADGPATVSRNGVSRRDSKLSAQRKADIRQHGRSKRAHAVAAECVQGSEGNAENSLILWALVALAVAMLLFAAHLEYVDVLLGSVTG